LTKSEELIAKIQQKPAIVDKINKYQLNFTNLHSVTRQNCAQKHVLLTFSKYF